MGKCPVCHKHEDKVGCSQCHLRERILKIIDELKEKDELNWHRINKMPKGSYTIKHVKIEELKHSIAKLKERK